MSKGFIKFKDGSYRNTDVTGSVFRLSEQFKSTSKGAYVTVYNDNKFMGMPEKLRVKVTSMKDYEFVSESDYDNVIATNEPIEFDEVARMAEIRERFDILTDMTTACIAGDIRAMIVSGPPGVGKSYGVEQEVDKATLFDQLADRPLKAEVVRGSTSAIGLYTTLYKYSDENCMLVFDDCDSVLVDDVCLNLLKGALDSGKKRKISWLADSNLLRREGVPDSFEFKGSVVFITNLKFENIRSQKLRDHLDALQSRCHYLDLTLDSMQDKLLRIKQIAGDGDLFQSYNFNQEQQDTIIAFMEKNKDMLREMSLRMALKIADLVKSFPDRWEAMALVTCAKLGAKANN
jgi:hypothetical protein